MITSSTLHFWWVRMKKRCISESYLFAKHKFCIINTEIPGWPLVCLIGRWSDCLFWYSHRGLNPYEMEFITSIGAFVPEWHVFIIVAQSWIWAFAFSLLCLVFLRSFSFACLIPNIYRYINLVGKTGVQRTNVSICISFYNRDHKFWL